MTWYADSASLVKSKIRTIPDFPTKGVLFRDITPLWGDEAAFKTCSEIFTRRFLKDELDLIAGIESRGFVVGAAVAAHMEKGFIPIRKKGKLPCEVEFHEYQLEYGTDCVEIHKDAIRAGQKILLVDDCLATGGTMLAAIHLLKKIGADVVGCAVVINLPYLGGDEKIKSAGHSVFSIVEF